MNIDKAACVMKEFLDQSKHDKL